MAGIVKSVSCLFYKHIGAGGDMRKKFLSCLIERKMHGSPAHHSESPNVRVTSRHTLLLILDVSFTEEQTTFIMVVTILTLNFVKVTESGSRRCKRHAINNGKTSKIVTCYDMILERGLVAEVLAKSKVF